MKFFCTFLVLFLSLLIVLSFHITDRYQAPYPTDIRPQFDDSIRNTYITILNEQQPDVFLLGDSMLDPALDETVLAEQLNKKIYSISLPGTASTIWYLMIKNNIAVAEHKPEYLVVFFRDAMMTAPGYRVTGRYFEQVDEFAGPGDEILIQRAYIDQMNPLEQLAEKYLPVYSSRWRIRQSIDYYIRYAPVRILLDCDQGCMDAAMDTVFEEDNMDQQFLNDAIAAADDYLYTHEMLDFNQQIDNSFLPEIVRLCKENNIQLVLVRMPIQRFYDPGTRPAGLDRYIQNLGDYLEKNGVYYLDYDQEKSFPGTYYDDAVHLNETGRDEFTRRLIEALKPIIK